MSNMALSKRGRLGLRRSRCRHKDQLFCFITCSTEHALECYHGEFFFLLQPLCFPCTFLLPNAMESLKFLAHRSISNAHKRCPINVTSR
ncbi:hypothetical protein M441DRAFT_455005 [Trichoderma asperellum CBS 433.97]|uniref:Uncharacterized protein n=1 Tax=Trichoderma asperellum (strain ATCC 204424 / CBS 433.97 / NBRC 101777) TaxID=1042311 RepID=A0A2T3ZE45_TRIA4|nr:hypothetical protein M441DRAFT_455005 [Trichoderma asperellum CBS 433.97]PTB43081.1 hypothetical protein M441DRAFT_455005 [Trichoderma asperellum CBS 433.97]